MALIITFRVDAERASGLVDAIKGLGYWGSVTPTCYLVETSLRPGVLMESLQRFVGPGDDLWIFSPTTSWAGYGNTEVDDIAVALLGNGDDWTPSE